jgi:hypothetical protein
MQSAFEKQQSSMAKKYGVKIDDPRPVGRSGIEYIKDDLDKITEGMQLANQMANIAGNAISNAFLSGKNGIDAATQALKQFIIQLLVVQSIMGIFNAITGGVGGFLGGFLSFLPKTGNPNLGTSNQTTPKIEVEGRITANGNDFVAQLNNVQNNYNRSVRIGNIVRD